MTIIRRRQRCSRREAEQQAKADLQSRWNREKEETRRQRHFDDKKLAAMDVQMKHCVQQEHTLRAKIETLKNTVTKLEEDKVSRPNVPIPSVVTDNIVIHKMSCTYTRTPSHKPNSKSIQNRGKHAHAHNK